ncbi:MAG: Aspartate carbamoyltransferase, partial [Alphaproteobacteria bacterium MarineAlpha2_Bin1]
MKHIKITDFSQNNILSIEDLSPVDINLILDLSENYVSLNKSQDKKISKLKGKTLINLFFESSTRTRT